MPISVTAPIGPAIRRAKWITFQPFDMRKWFVLGFSAFLASLGEGGGVNFNSPGGGGGRTTPPVRPPGPGRGPAGPSPAPAGPNPFDDVMAWVSHHRLETALIALALLVAMIALGLLLTWLGSRGKLMFIDGIARNTAEVAAPWRRFRRHGNSLFRFRFWLGVITLGAMLVVVGVAALIAWPDIRDRQFATRAVAALLLGIVLLLPLVVLSALIGWCTDRFVTVIMLARDTTVGPAWREFRRDVLAGHVGTLTLFLLMEILLGFATGIIQTILGCVTLCVGFLPYLSSVLALPLEVFSRSYPIYFLQQFGPQYAILYEPPPPAYGFPVVMHPPPTVGPPLPPPLPPVA